MNEDTDGLRTRLTRQGEDALGKLAQDLLENPLVNGAIARAFEAREKATQAQEVAMGALNLPSAADLERLTRRLRSVSQRLEGIEDGVDRLDERSRPRRPRRRGLDERLRRIEEAPRAVAAELSTLREALPDRSRAGPARAGAPQRSASEGRTGAAPGSPVPATARACAPHAARLARPSSSSRWPRRSRSWRSPAQVGDGEHAAPPAPVARGEPQDRRRLHLDRERAVGHPPAARSPRA